MLSQEQVLGTNMVETQCQHDRTWDILRGDPSKYDKPGEDGYVSPAALTRRLHFIPDYWQKGFSRKVQAWGSRAHFMQVRVLWFMQHWFKRWKVTIRKLHYVSTPRGGYIISPESSASWAEEQLKKYPDQFRWAFDSAGKRRRIS